MCYLTRRLHSHSKVWQALPQLFVHPAYGIITHRDTEQTTDCQLAEHFKLHFAEEFLSVHRMIERPLWIVGRDLCVLKHSSCHNKHLALTAINITRRRDVIHLTVSQRDKNLYPDHHILFLDIQDSTTSSYKCYEIYFENLWKAFRE